MVTAILHLRAREPPKAPVRGRLLSPLCFLAGAWLFAGRRALGLTYLPMTEPDTDQLLLQRVASGEQSARDELFARHRDRLRRMIQVRMDRRIVRRVDPSDVIQEALIEATRLLPDYLERQPVLFYPWLRRIAWKSLARLHRTHAQTGKRDVGQEVDIGLPDDSVMALAQIIAAPEAVLPKKRCETKCIIAYNLRWIV